MNQKKENNPVGRPASIKGRRVQVYLDAASEIEADRLGRGNASEGIRLALKMARDMTLNEITKKLGSDHG